MPPEGVTEEAPREANERRTAETAFDPLESVIVRVLTKDRAVLMGATVFSKEERFGKTDATGELGVSRDRLKNKSSIGAALDKFGPAHYTLPAPIPDLIELTLPDACKVSGTVQTATGERPEEILVAIWPTDLSVTSSDVSRQLTATQPAAADIIRIERADRNGDFSFDNLSPQYGYTITAGAPGWIAPERVSIASACHSGLARILLQPLYGAIISLEDSTGAELKSAPEILRKSVMGIQSKEGKPTLLLSDCPEAGLAGINSLLTRSSQTMMYLAVSAESIAKVGPLIVSFDVMGYAPARFEVWLERVTLDLPVYPCRLTTVSNSWGRLAVNLIGYPQSCTRTDNVTQAPTRLMLRTNEGTTRIAHIVPGSGAVTLEPLPQGQYSAYITMCGGLYETEAQQIAVTDSSEVSFSLTDLGCVQFQVDFGKRDTGHANMGVLIWPKEKEEDDGANLFIAHPPYIINGVPPGTYSAKLYLSPNDHVHISNIEVRSAEISPVQVRWEER